MSAALRQFVPRGAGSLCLAFKRIAGAAGSAADEKKLPGGCGRFCRRAAFA
jgi:hypothetical protein